jgi:hypothetical protein
MPNFRSGVSGGTGGQGFDDSGTAAGGIPDDSFAVRLRIRHGAVIDAVQMVIDRPGAAETVKPQHGGNGGTLKEITLERGEFIREIRGRYASTVNTMIIVTNVHTYPKPEEGVGGEYGNGGDVDYAYIAPWGHEIIGFFGRAGSLLNAIGVIITTR